MTVCSARFLRSPEVLGGSVPAEVQKTRNAGEQLLLQQLW